MGCPAVLWLVERAPLYEIPLVGSSPDQQETSMSTPTRSRSAASVRAQYGALGIAITAVAAAFLGPMLIG